MSLAAAGCAADDGRVAHAPPEQAAVLSTLSSAAGVPARAAAPVTDAAIPTAPPKGAAKPTRSPTEIVIFGFEGSLGGWAIPDWAKGSSDHVCEEIRISQDYASEGRHALELLVGFTGYRWTGGYVEREVDSTDWSPFGRLSVDIYLPEGAPQGLGGRLILTVGDDWTWTEMNRTIPLQPGGWTTVSANLQPRSMDWKFFPDERFRAKVRKMGVRIESNREPVYRGSVYVDNIRLAESL